MKSRLWIYFVLPLCFAACKDKSEKPNSDKTVEPAAAADKPDEPVEANQPSTAKLSKVTVEGAELEVRDFGEGPAILFIHGAVLRDALLPLASEAALSEGYRVISYGRRGYGGKPTEAATMAVQAADAAAVLKSLGVEKAHVVSWSFGANIALQMALDNKDMVASLTLMEPVLANQPSSEAENAIFAPVFEAYGKGDKAASLDAFMTVMAGPDHKAAIDSTLPEGAYDLALADYDTMYDVEFPALMAWTFPADKAYQGLNMPVLFLAGANSLGSMREGGDVIAEWFPQAKRHEVADAKHTFPISKSAEVAAEISSFITSQD